MSTKEGVESQLASISAALACLLKYVERQWRRYIFLFITAYLRDDDAESAQNGSRAS